MTLRLATKADVRKVLAELSPPMQRLLLEIGSSRGGMPATEARSNTRVALWDRNLVLHGGPRGAVTLSLTGWGHAVLKELRRQRRAWAKSLQAEIQAGVVS